MAGKGSKYRKVNQYAYGIGWRRYCKANGPRYSYGLCIYCGKGAEDHDNNRKKPSTDNV